MSYDDASWMRELGWPILGGLGALFLLLALAGLLGWLFVDEATWMATFGADRAQILRAALGNALVGAGLVSAGRAFVATGTARWVFAAVGAVLVVVGFVV